MRSYLYVPGNRSPMLASALSRGADGLIVDLEDGVPPVEQESARDDVARWLRSLPARSPVCLDANGRVVDLAVVPQARRTLRDGGLSA
jgi:citrate lyase subunit beta/citryl-CoA lyase